MYEQQARTKENRFQRMQFLHETLETLSLSSSSTPEHVQHVQHVHVPQSPSPASAAMLMNTTVIVAALATYIFSHFVSAIRQVYDTVQQYVLRRLVSTCTIRDMSEVYPEVDAYIRTKLSTTRIRLVDQTTWFNWRFGNEDGDYEKEDMERKGQDPKLAYEHSDDGSWYTFRDHGRRFWVRTHSKSNKQRPSSMATVMTIATLGSSVHPLLELLKRARDVKKEERACSVLVQFEDNLSRRIPSRSWDTIFLPVGIKARLREDLRWFLNSREFYRSRGVPYRRGYCLYGPPGTGKTSACIAMASEAGLVLKVINISSCNSDTFRQEIGSMGPRTLLLLEDIDAALPTKTALAGTDAVVGTGAGAGAGVGMGEEGSDDGDGESAGGGEGDGDGDGDGDDDGTPGSGRRGFSKPTLSLSVILNTLDGVCSPDALLFVMTTNHMDQIPGSLKRRCPVTVFVDNPAETEIGAMFVNMFPEDEGLAPAFCKGVATLKTQQSMCRLQNHCMRFRDAQDAIDNIEALDTEDM
jgi:hypothetical protein